MFAGNDRGQTLQDYVVGISVFIVVVFLALAFFPQLLSGFQTTDIADSEAQADRVARQIVTNNTVPGTTNELNATKMDVLMNQTEDELRQRFRLNSTVNLNMSIVSLDGRQFVLNATGDPLTSRPRYFGNDAGSAARIVTLSNDSFSNCDPACRLEVRAW
jgi:hypothetical protein